MNLSELSIIDNWHEFARGLDKVLKSNDELSGRSAGEIIIEVSQKRDQSAVSIRMCLRAYRFIAQYYPDFEEPGSIRCGMTLVIELARIHSLSIERADELHEKVLSDRVALTSLKAEYERLKVEVSKNSPETVQRSTTTSKSKTFEKIVGSFGNDLIKLIYPDWTARVYPRRYLGPIRADFIVKVGRDERVAIEGKVFGGSSRSAQIISTLGRISLITRLVPEYWLIVPEGSQDLLKELSIAAKAFNLKDVRYFLLGEQKGDKSWDYKEFIPPVEINGASNKDARL